MGRTYKILKIKSWPNRECLLLGYSISKTTYNTVVSERRDGNEYHLVSSSYKVKADDAISIPIKVFDKIRNTIVARENKLKELKELLKDLLTRESFSLVNNKNKFRKLDYCLVYTINDYTSNVKHFYHLINNAKGGGHEVFYHDDEKEYKLYYDLDISHGIVVKLTKKEYEKLLSLYDIPSYLTEQDEMIKTLRFLSR